MTLLDVDALEWARIITKFDVKQSRIPTNPGDFNLTRLRQFNRSLEFSRGNSPGYMVISRRTPGEFGLLREISSFSGGPKQFSGATSRPKCFDFNFRAPSIILRTPFYVLLNSVIRAKVTEHSYNTSPCASSIYECECIRSFDHNKRVYVN